MSLSKRVFITIGCKRMERTAKPNVIYSYHSGFFLFLRRSHFTLTQELYSKNRSFFSYWVIINVVDFCFKNRSDSGLAPYVNWSNWCSIHFYFAYRNFKYAQRKSHNYRFWNNINGYQSLWFSYFFLSLSSCIAI